MNRSFFRFFSFITVTFFTITLLANSESSIIVRVKGEHGFFLAKRICEELNAIGLDAIPREASDDGPSHSEESAEKMAKNDGTAAGISIDVSKGIVDVWVADRVTGKNVHRITEIRTTHQPLNNVVVVTAVELLRASLMELNNRKKPEGKVPATREMEELASSNLDDRVTTSANNKDLIHVEMGPAISAATFDSKPTVSILTEIHARFLRKLQFGVIGLLPVGSSSSDFDSGHVKIVSGFVGGEMALSLGKPESRIFLYPGIGLGAAFFKISGSPSDGHLGHEVFNSVTSFLGHLMVGLRINDRLAVRFDSLFIWTMREQVVLDRDNEVISLGQPWISGAILIDVTVF